jgi:hypothetical protein
VTNTAKYTVREGLEVIPSPYAHIALGETGPGRKRVRLAVGVRDFPQFDTTRVNTRLGDRTLWSTDEKGKDVATEYMIKHGDFKDEAQENEWIRAHTQPRRLVKASFKKLFKTGNLMLVKERGVDLDMAIVQLNIVAGEGGQTVWTGKGYSPVVEGFHAQGNDGSKGGHPHGIITMRPGAEISIQRTGELYGAPALWLLSWDGEQLLARTPEED